MAKIFCQNCTTPVRIKYAPGIESKYFTCPICKKKSKIGDCRIEYEANEKPSKPEDDGPTVYGETGNGKTQYYSEHTRYDGEQDGATVINSAGEQTQIRPHFNLIGRIIVEDRIDPATGKPMVFSLRPGKNLIGRKSNDCSADFPIPCTDLRMSREHIEIDVKQGKQNGFVHFLTLYRERVNETKFGKKTMAYGDVYILNPGDEILLPGAKLRFEI